MIVEGQVSKRVSREAGRDEDDLSTIVFFCQDLQDIGNGLDIMELCQWLETADWNVRGRAVPELCHSPEGLFQSVSGKANRVVLCVCARDYAELEVQSQARKAGLDPIGIEVLNLGAFCSLIPDASVRLEKAKVLLAATVAKARAYSGSSPESLSPYFPSLSQRVSRRALFTLPTIRYKAVASIDGQRCVAERGCEICVRACPKNALQNSGGALLVSKAQCDGCGICVTECPQGAVEFPDGTSRQFEAQVAALLEAGSNGMGERRILFTCRGGTEAIGQAGQNGVGTSASWLPVVVRCTGMITVGWILQCVAAGASVGVVSCSEGCSLNQDKTASGRVDYCRELLRLLGGSPELVRIVDPWETPSSGQMFDDNANIAGSRSNGTAPQPVVFGSDAFVNAMKKLAEIYEGITTLRFEHPYSPAGAVDIERQHCTACGVCAETCPTMALQFERRSNKVALTFDAGLCVACGQCSSMCPEANLGAIRVERVTDFARLTNGREILHEDMERRCKACGGPVATQGMLNRIASLLGEESAVLMDEIEQYCSSCRMNR